MRVASFRSSSDRRPGRDPALQPPGYEPGLSLLLSRGGTLPRGQLVLVGAPKATIFGRATTRIHGDRKLYSEATLWRYAARLETPSNVAIANIVRGCGRARDGCCPTRLRRTFPARRPNRCSARRNGRDGQNGRGHQSETRTGHPRTLTRPIRRSRRCGSSDLIHIARRAVRMSSPIGGAETEDRALAGRNDAAAFWRVPDTGHPNLVASGKGFSSKSLARSKGRG